MLEPISGHCHLSTQSPFDWDGLLDYLGGRLLHGVAALHTIARDVADGSLDLSPGVDPQLVGEKLIAIHGIGDWTFQYIALRALRWPDAFTAGDLGIRKALGVAKPDEVKNIAERWRPWRGYAVFHLWRRLA